MNEPLPDTQNESDARELTIHRVGVRRLRYPCVYRGMGGGEQGTVADYEMTVELPGHLRGTHMSRFVEALHGCEDALEPVVLGRLTEDLAKRLSAERARVSCDFPIFLRKLAPVSGMASLMDYELGMSFSYDPAAGNRLDMRVAVPVATLCPCSKAISERGAHNQRGVVRISVEVGEKVEFEELIELAEASASCELYSGLKRIDEKAVTERAYDQPVFVEDLARNVAVALKVEKRIRSFRVEAENFESIHHHNAYAMIEG